jgi:hypothetical protein
VIGWLVAAWLLWQTAVPDDLVLPNIDPTRGLGPQVVDEAEDFETFTRWNFVLSQLAFLGALGLYAWRGARFTRESAAGRIGTGMLLGMLGLALAGLSQLPFQLGDLWWQRRHGLWKTGYLDWFVESWAVLGAEFLFICFWLLITMALAAVLRKRWWLPATPVFVALAVLFAFTLPYLVPNQKPAPPDLKRDAVLYAERQHIEPVKVVVERESDLTSVPNAQAAGLDRVAVSSSGTRCSTGASTTARFASCWHTSSVTTRASTSGRASPGTRSCSCRCSRPSRG